MTPESDKPPQGGWFARIEDLFATIAQWALAVLLALVVFQIFTRYVLNDPFGEVVTITETYLMPAMVFFAIAALQREDGHIRVDLLYVRFKGRTRQLIDLIINVASVAFWVVVIYASATETFFSLRMDYEVSRTLPVPLWTALAVVPIGSALIAIRLLFQTADTVASLRRPLPESDVPA